MNPTEQNTSAKIANENDSMLPIPNGSGKLSDAVSMASHLSMPWLRSMRPKAMRAARMISDEVMSDGRS